MPLSKAAKQHLAAARRAPDPERFGSFLTRQGARYSGDIDIFHDRAARVGAAAEHDVAALKAAGLDMQWQRREPLFYQVLVNGAGKSTKLEWVVDSDFRFYPAQRDPDFGYVLHPADLATNKIMAAAGRREPRDVIDLIDIHACILPLGAVAWAAVGRSFGFTPEGLINEVRRLARYTAADFERVAESSRRLMPARSCAAYARHSMKRTRSSGACQRTRSAYCSLQDGQMVQPDPDRLDAYTMHAGARHGHWPSSADSARPCRERYGKPSP